MALLQTTGPLSVRVTNVVLAPYSTCFVPEYLQVPPSLAQKVQPPLQPRLPMRWRRRFKSYVNLGTTEAKVAGILDEFPITTFSELLSSYEAAAAA